MASVKPKGSATNSQKKRAASIFSSNAKMTPAKVRQEMGRIEDRESRLMERIGKLEEELHRLDGQQDRLQARCKHVNTREVADEIGQRMTWECTDCGY
jgi:plasmid replication initiation protein